ncbi:MAG: DUF6491 family protein [Marinicella sp.]
MKILILFTAALLLSACQSNNRSRVDYAAFISSQGLVQKNRVQQFRFQGWQPLDARYLILRSNQRKSYLIKLMSYCNELPYAQTIHLNQGTGSTLNAKFDSILIPGHMQQECTIHSIYEMDKVQKQALLDLSNQSEEIRG